MPDDLESYAPQSTEPGSSTSMTQNEASGLGDANSAPSATYPPANDTFFPIDFDLFDDHTTFQSPQQLGFDADFILPQLEEETFAQNLPVSGVDNDNILHEVGEVAAAALMQSYANYPPTNGSTATPNPQIASADTTNIPPGLHEAGPTSTAGILGYPLISTNQLQSNALSNALALTGHINPIGTTYSDLLGEQTAIPSPTLTLTEALDPMFFAMWNPGSAQPMRRLRGITSRGPSREEVVNFIDGLEKVDVESLESDGRECGICRGAYGEPVSMNACMPESPVKLPCRHVFGVECLTLLLSPKPGGWGNRLCPLCRVWIEVPRAVVREAATAQAPGDANSVPLEIDL